MTTDFSNLKPILDLPCWEPLGTITAADSTAVTGTAGTSMASDLRCSEHRSRNIWFLKSIAILVQYNAKNNGWVQLASPALTGTFGNGASMVFAPSHGPRGSISAGATTTSFTISSALPNSASLSPNQLKGIRVRVIGNTSGGSGLTEERTILSNTGGTTPTITLESALSFTPAAGATYEILSGRLYMLSAGTLASNSFKYFDIATNAFNTTALPISGLPGSVSTDGYLLSLDELHTPITGIGNVAINGEVGGYFGTLTATASSSTSLTGQLLNGDSGVVENEYRNFQIRIVEDVTQPEAVGQRRRISSHTAGTSPEYTVPSWDVTPSSSAKYVIENNNDIIFTTAATAIYTYNAVTNAWSSSTYAAKPSAGGAGLTCWHPFNRTIDSDKNARHSYLYFARGGGSNIIDRLDIAGASNGAWSADIPYDNKGLTLFNTGGSSIYEPITNRTFLMPFAVSNTAVGIYTFNNDTMSLTAYVNCPQIHGTSATGERLAISMFIDGTAKRSFVYCLPSTQSLFLRLLSF